MRTETTTRTTRLLLLLVVIASLATVTSPALASDGCGGDDQSAAIGESLVTVSVATGASAANTGQGCLTADVAPEYQADPDGSGEAGCLTTCSVIEASVTVEAEVAAEASDAGVSGEDSPLLSTHASEQSQTCVTAGSRTGTQCPHREPAAEPSPDPAPEPTPDPTSEPAEESRQARSVSLNASADEVAPNDSVHFFGDISGEDVCAAGQAVQLMAKRPGQAGFRIFRIGSTDAFGAFGFEVVVGNAREFRVLIPGNDGCDEIISGIVTLRSAR